MKFFFVFLILFNGVSRDTPCTHINPSVPSTTIFSAQSDFYTPHYALAEEPGILDDIEVKIFTELENNALNVVM